MLHAHAVSYPALRRRRGLAFFWARKAQHVRSVATLREVLRAAVALGGVTAWGGLLLLLGG